MRADACSRKITHCVTFDRKGVGKKKRVVGQFAVKCKTETTRQVLQYCFKHDPVICLAVFLSETANLNSPGEITIFHRPTFL
jgi:hypothetical protein